MQAGALLHPAPRLTKDLVDGRTLFVLGCIVIIGEVYVFLCLGGDVADGGRGKCIVGSLCFSMHTLINIYYKSTVSPPLKYKKEVRLYWLGKLI